MPYFKRRFWYTFSILFSKKKQMARYSKKASDTVESAVHRMKKGTLRSGRSDKKVNNRKQAIAIGLSEAREKGAKVPKAPARKRKSISRKAK
jgi:hypothetical protein